MRVKWHDASRVLESRENVQVLPSHLKDDHPHLSSGTSNTHQARSRLAWEHLHVKFQLLAKFIFLQQFIYLAKQMLNY